jgi:hypothetical protein
MLNSLAGRRPPTNSRLRTAGGQRLLLADISAGALLTRSAACGASRPLLAAKAIAPFAGRQRRPAALHSNAQQTARLLILRTVAGGEAGALAAAEAAQSSRCTCSSDSAMDSELGEKAAMADRPRGAAQTRRGRPETGLLFCQSSARRKWPRLCSQQAEELRSEQQYAIQEAPRQTKGAVYSMYGRVGGLRGEKTREEEKTMGG